MHKGAPHAVAPMPRRSSPSDTDPAVLAPTHEPLPVGSETLPPLPSHRLLVRHTHASDLPNPLPHKLPIPSRPPSPVSDTLASIMRRPYSQSWNGRHLSMRLDRSAPPGSQR